MKKSLLLFLAVLVSLVLIVNSTKRVLKFRTTSQKIQDLEVRLQQLKKENEVLKKELEYQKGTEFAEKEIRNKLGLVKEGETVVILPKEEAVQKPGVQNQKLKPNWQKWWYLFFGR